jgi:hypothetical protein
MELEKGQVSEDAALQLCFSQVDVNMGKSRYDRLRTYKRRYNSNELGLRAKDKILKEFGFKLVAKIYEMPASK